ncbi:hypothetical protein [Deinococcus ficus]|uniref:Uncharacterized protein n=1 Tax=Deinococcus ficus TaxID=317577 RepID=A0A221T317_9DEIO|nr:hypothetical protein [Deinococcus ficus]ASN83298.1 hypothetical protein DFI_19055 [Deinococcus ficus]
MKNTSWTALYALLLIGAVLIFILGQWGAAVTVVALMAILNRLIYISEMALRIVLNQQEMLKLAKAGRREQAEAA